MNTSRILPFQIILSIGLAFLAFNIYSNPKSESYRIPKHINIAYREWKSRFNILRSSPEEDDYRLKVFYDSWKLIKETNEQQKDYELELNKFADMTSEELSTKLTMGKQFSEISNKEEGLITENENDDESEGLSSSDEYYDWEKYLLPVRDQKRCGSCWAFSTVTTIEGMYGIYENKMQYLSPQYLVDCGAGNGCSGGRQEDAMKFIKKTGGVPSESDYPYTGREEDCKNPKNKTPIKGYRTMSNFFFFRTMKALRSGLEHGPIVINLNAKNIYFYKRGIFTGKCTGYSDYHSVTLIGNGKEDGKEYWKIRNSWGRNWGENGNFRLLVGKDCPIWKDAPAQPII